MSNGPKKLIGAVIKIILAAVVLVYLGLHTINFFTFTFPPEQWYLAWLGFGLTGGGLIGYLVVFLWDADTDLKKTTALLMILICGAGEVLAAGFGMQIEAWSKNGWTMTEQDFNMMLLAIRALAFAHFIALTVYVAGDQIGVMFDKNKNGIPDFLEKMSPPILENETTVRQPEIKLTNFTEEQIQQLAQILARYNAENERAGQGTNGQHADPTSQPRR